jgi:hypothetical protein
MAIEKNQPWYVEKRARAYVYSLFADRNITVRDESQQNFGVDFIIDLRKGERELGRYLAVQLFAYPDFPGVADLDKKVARQLPSQLREDMGVPLIAFIVQVRELDARYGWIIEPFVGDEGATLRHPSQYDWKKLDDRAMKVILERVNEYWDELLKRVKQS